MAFAPNNKIWFLQVPIGLNNKNQIDFKDAKEQVKYFKSKVVKEYFFEDLTYIRKDNTIDVEIPIDKLWSANYLMYQNTMFTDKYFYCFITNKEYLNSYTTRITFTTDVFQTWQFDYEIKRSFVEREMIDVVDDIPRSKLAS